MSLSVLYFNMIMKLGLWYNHFMNKFLISLMVAFFICDIAFSMISPKARHDVIINSQIKTPAVVTGVKTIQNRKGNRVQRVNLDGLYDNSAKKYVVECRNFKRIFPWDTPLIGGNVNYYPKKGQRVFVTIDCPDGKITSMTIMDEKFEKKLQETPQKLKYNYNGAYFDD